MENGASQSNLIGADLEEILALMADRGEPKFRARQIFSGIYRRRLRSWDAFTDLGKRLRAELAKEFALDYPPVRQTFASSDGTIRYLFEVPPARHVEAVFIPEDRRDTFCISTQVGCAVECLFCVTGKIPLRRNLTPAEILGQVLQLQCDRPRADKRLNIVIMGMGEPLHNYDNVMKAFRLMTEAEGMGLPPRRITLSTSGVVPEIDRLGRETVVPNLAVSLNATTDEVRDVLIPINRKWNIAALLEACRRFPLEPRRHLTFEYVLIDGVNDTDDDAVRLVALTEGLRKKVNLIPLNADPWVPLKPSPERRVLDFQRILIDRGINAHIRRPRGDDVSAACGMLAGREQARGDRSHPPPKPPRSESLVRLGLND